MPSSCRRSTARAQSSYGMSNSIRDFNSRPSLSNHSHIQTRPAETIPEHPEPDHESEAPDFIIKESAQEEIRDQLEYETRLQLLRKDYSTSPTSTSPTRNLTFAEVTMAARSSRSRRRNEALYEGPDMILGGPMTLESLGPFRYTFKKKKNLKSKYSASIMNGETIGSDDGGVSVNDTSVGTSTSTSTSTNTRTRTRTSMDMGYSETTSEIGTDPDLVGGRSGGEGSSRPISPAPTPQFKSSHDFPHTTSQKQLNLSEFTFPTQTSKRVTQTLQTNSEDVKHFVGIREIDCENDFKNENDNDKENINNIIAQSIGTSVIPVTSGTSTSTTTATTTATVTTTVTETADTSCGLFPPLVILSPPGLSKVSSFSNSSNDLSRAQTLNTVHSGIDLNHSSLDFLKCDDSDTQSVKEKSEAVMARIAGSTAAMMRSVSDLTAINDGFDSVEWDPDLPVRSINDSPEPLLVEAQPVAYTTVGSRVNPNVQPQISAPNRIQREGSMRRPQLDLTHNRQANYYPHTRGPPPPLNMQNSMHYAQQLGQHSNSFNTPPATSARSVRPIRPSQRLSQSDQETHTLLRLQGMVNARAPGGHHPASPNTPTPVSHNDHVSSISNEEQDMGRGNDLQGPISGLEKMQTLQRLARFPNPMQTSALRRLSELQAPKNDNTASLNASVEGAGQCLENLPRNLKDRAMLDEAQAAKNGELDRGYTFPPPGISNKAYNPLFGIYGGSSGHARDSAHHRGVPGYPQPLTAGPPGQRSYANNRQSSSYSEDAWTQDQASAKQNSLTNPGPVSPWQEPKIDNEQHGAQASSLPPSARATDTISLQQALQYYPRGFASDMTGRFTRLSSEVQREMGHLDDEETPEQARARKQKEKDEWFYNGQKRWNMTTEDHITEIETHANPFGPIAPPLKKTVPSDNRPLPGITISEMQKKTIPEVIAPMLDGTFGNMFAIAAQQKEGNSTLPFNRYTKSPAWHIDSSEKGNDSFFGEDLGAYQFFATDEGQRGLPVPINVDIGIRTSTKRSRHRTSRLKRSAKRCFQWQRADILFLPVVLPGANDACHDVMLYDIDVCLPENLMTSDEIPTLLYVSDNAGQNGDLTVECTQVEAELHGLR
ncbi:hypothetical protein SBOR_7885 [Sclerotinia borealis F-4128]|uniref:Uncharacterized protein n=1 Tax=Sclerotinia borealis (strain F-4128) TaxID=1432307 RepID=W9CA45_SCLBF|nr:hypothetical protein SBOR_7885 [Sclerotinia borealis F-4128]